MNENSLDKLIRSHFDQTSDKVDLSADFTSGLMGKIYLEKLKIIKQQRLTKSLITVLGLLTAWSIILSTLWGSELLQTSLGRLMTQIQTLNINVSWLKYAVLMFLVHSLAVRLVIGIPFIFKKISF